MKTKILVVDDEKSICDTLNAILTDENYEVMIANSGEEAIAVLRNETPDVILLDIWMKGMDGLETLKKVKELDPELAIIMMSGHGTIETAVKATKLGAFDFIEKPLSLEKILVSIQNAINMRNLSSENQRLRENINASKVMLGDSDALKKLHSEIDRVAPTDAWVLITGDNGTGKELVANAIHNRSARFNRAFIKVDCASIPEELIESELFGHEKGAFTGATKMKKGKFDLANEGTLFLDEIGDMSLKTQAKILRILEEQKFERVGGSEVISVNVRVLAATNKNLEEDIKKGNFREDLYHRIHVVPIHVPTLKERNSDIAILANNFLKTFAENYGMKQKTLSDEAIACLKKYSWPGNVRELRNLIERLVVMTASEVIDVENLPLSFLQTESGSEIDPENMSLKDARQVFEKEFISKKLTENNWNISKTASILGIERTNLYKKMKLYGLEQNDKS